MREYIVLFSLFLPFSMFAQGFDSLMMKRIDSLVASSEKFLIEKNKSKADSLIFLVDSLTLNQMGPDSRNYASNCFKRAVIYYNSKEYKQAERNYQLSKKIFTKFYDDTSQYVIKCRSDLAMVYRDNKNFNASEQEYLELKEILIKNKARNTSQFVDYLNGIGLLYIDMEKFNSAKELFLEAKSIQTTLFGGDHESIANTYNNLAKLYTMLGDYDEALKNYLETLRIREKSLGKTNLLYTISLLNIASFYKEIGQYENAETSIRNAITIRERIYGKSHPYYATCLANLADLYKEMLIYDSAIELYKKVNEIRKKSLGADNEIYTIGVNNLASLYKETKNYSEAKLLYSEALEIREKVLGKMHPQYAEILNNLGEIYVLTHEYEKANTYFVDALEIIDSTIGKRNTDYADCLNNLGDVQNKMGRSLESERSYLESYEILKSIYGVKHYKLAESMNKLAKLYFDLQNYEKADSLMLESKRLFEKVFGKKHILYTSCLDQLCNSYEIQNKFDKSEPIIKQLSLSERERLEKGATFLSEKELAYYAEAFEVQNDKIGNYIVSRPDKPYLRDNLSTILMNNIIFSKGFLQTSAEQINHLPVSSKEMLGLKLRLSNLQRLLAIEYSKPRSEQKKVDKLEETSNILEKKLRKSISGYEDATKQVDWKDVKDVLKKNEAVVEFFNFQSVNLNGKVHSIYAAILIKSEGIPIEFITLCSSDALDSLLGSKMERKADYVNKLYTNFDRGAVALVEKSRSLYELIWKPIESRLSGIKTIYYSPSGLLYRINLNAIPISETEVLADQYKLIELNSTRKLVIPSQVNCIQNNAILFGGIQFDQDSTILQQLNIFGINTRSGKSLKNNVVINKAESWNYLPGTEREVNSIEQIVKNNGFIPTLYKANDATESTFKKIGTDSSVSPRILHIATHGFFYPDQKKPIQTLDSIHQKEPVFKISGHPMLRSGLIFAGANAAWQGDKTAKGSDDGILTAFEIAQMNLSNTELVVLSACETGLGEIQGNEGVYGLQRAFKIAGVKYIIMSLWQVPDKQTSLLMTTFYKKWLEDKMTLPNAFHAAQQQLRDNGLDPYNWAGFVLVE
ncbi:MAG: CHAT domain-containing tetratricopeptide repeat protein [Saprospiraceae bacterium]